MNKYDSYKNSGIEWIGKIPNHWGANRLRFVSKIIPSNIDKKSKDDEQSVKLCNYVDVYKNDFITADLDFMVATAAEHQIDKLSLLAKDVIATKDSEDPNDIGVPALVNETLKGAVCGYHLTLLRAEKNKLDGEYLYWFVRSNRTSQYFSVNARGITRYAIGSNVFKNLQVSLPPINEQIGISNYLKNRTTDIDNLISKKERLIKLLEEEKTAVINQRVTKGLDPNIPMKDSGVEWLGEIPEHWVLKRLKHVCNLISEKTSEKPNYVLALENIESWTGNIIGDPYNNGMSGDVSLFNKGDVLFNKLRPYLAKVHLTKIDGGSVGELLVLRPTKNISSEFLYYRMISEAIITIVDNSTYGAKMPRASWDKFISNIEIGLPPFEEQERISAYISSNLSHYSVMKEKLVEEINLLKEYKTALISEVVTGKVDVRDEVLVN